MRSRQKTTRNGGNGKPVPTGSTLKGPAVVLKEDGSIQSYRSLMTTRWHMPRGQASGCRQKRSGSLHQEEGRKINATAGETKCGRRGSSWPTHFKVFFQPRMTARTDSLEAHR